MKFSALYVSPEPRLFRAGESEVLASVLSRQGEGLETVVPDGADWLQLTPAGLTTRFGRRYTRLAFGQLCSALCPGLSRTVQELAGAVRRPEQPAELFSLDAAISIFNRAVQQRWQHVFESRALLVDADQGTIEGTVGPARQVVDNVTLLELVENAAAGAAAPTKFTAAELIGRRLQILYLADEPFTNVAGPCDDWYRLGTYVANADVGETAIRVLTTFYRDLSGGWAVDTTQRRRGRQVHTGQRLIKGLASMLSSAFDFGRFDPTDLTTKLGKLQERQLSTAPMFDKADRGLVRLCNRLQDSGLSRASAWEVIRTALALGAYPEHSAYRRARGGSDYYDLFGVLLESAAGLGGGAGLPYSQCAGTLLCED